MLQVRQTFQRHRDEINLYFDFLDKIISHDGRLIIDPPTDTIVPITIDTTAIMKASFFMMLYNCVESTVGNCLNTLFKQIEEDACKYADLIEPIQVAALAAYEYKIIESNSKDNRAMLLKQQTDFTTGASVTKLDIRSVVRSSSQGSFSGSLDSHEIEKIFGRLGLDLSGLSCREMQTIKTGRNKLAHGEQTFQEYGSTYPVQYLRECKDKTLVYLNILIGKVDDFIKSHGYKK